jgi:hypothetical protein
MTRIGPSERDREARRLAAFASIAASLAHSEDLESALSQALRATLEALNLEAGGIYLLDESSGELRATDHHLGLPPEYPQAVARFRRGEGPIGRALDAVHPVVGGANSGPQDPPPAPPPSGGGAWGVGAR